MSTLVWSVKASLLAYIRGMDDGEVVLDGVAEVPGGFAFPGEGLQFRGAVTLIAHGGMMHVVLRDPSLAEDRDRDRWMLWIADPDDAAVRLPFARIGSVVDDGGVRRGSATMLTADGADLFFGPYLPGTPLDDPLVLV